MHHTIQNSKRELIDSVPKVIVYCGTAVVIWFFAKTFFIPLGDTVSFGNLRVSAVIAAISILVIFLLLVKIIREVRDICDAVSTLTAFTLIHSITSNEFEVLFHIVHVMTYVTVAVIKFILIGSLLTDIHPILTSFFLIVTFIMVVTELYSTGLLLSAKVGAWVKKIDAKF